MCSRKVLARILSPVGTICFSRHAAPTELEKEVIGASVLHISRSYGTFQELFDLLMITLILSGYLLLAFAE